MLSTVGSSLQKVSIRGCWWPSRRRVCLGWSLMRSMPSGMTVCPRCTLSRGLRPGHPSPRPKTCSTSNTPRTSNSSNTPQVCKLYNTNTCTNSDDHSVSNIVYKHVCSFCRASGKNYKHSEMYCHKKQGKDNT